MILTNHELLGRPALCSPSLLPRIILTRIQSLPEHECKHDASVFITTSHAYHIACVTQRYASKLRPVNVTAPCFTLSLYSCHIPDNTARKFPPLRL